MHASVAEAGELQRRHDVEFDEIVVDGGAGTEFEAVTDFVAEGVERIGGAETRRAALHAFALGDEAVAARIHCDIESHAAGSLRLDIDAVNDADLADSYYLVIKRPLRGVAAWFENPANRAAVGDYVVTADGKLVGIMLTSANASSSAKRTSPTARCHSRLKVLR
jgi:hypothetical protein